MKQHIKTSKLLRDEAQQLIHSAKRERDREWCAALIEHCTTEQIQGITDDIISGRAHGQAERLSKLSLEQWAERARRQTEQKDSP